MDAYQRNGYKDRASYLVALSEEYNVDLEIVVATADLYGPNEDFDGLVNALEDM